MTLPNKPVGLTYGTAKADLEKFVVPGQHVVIIGANARLNASGSEPAWMISPDRHRSDDLLDEVTARWVTAPSKYATAAEVSELAAIVSTLAARGAIWDSQIAALQRDQARVSSWFQTEMYRLTSLVDDWDGAGARRITPATAQSATDLAAYTVDVTGEPEPVPLNDGSVELLWTFSAESFATHRVLEQETTALVLVSRSGVTERPIVSDDELLEALRVHMEEASRA